MGQAGIACLCSTTWSSAGPPLFIRPLVLHADGYYPLARLGGRSNTVVSTASTSARIGPSVHQTLIDAPPLYVFARTENLTPGKDSRRAVRTSLAVSAQEIRLPS